MRGKKSKEQIRRFMANRDVLLARLRDMIINNKFKTSKYRIIKIHEPKERYIYVLPLYPDHIVHHALINILGPIWQRMFIRDSFACIPNRGLFSAFIYTLCYPKYIGASILKVVIKTTPRNRDVVIYSGAPRRIPSHGTYMCRLWGIRDDLAARGLPNLLIVEPFCSGSNPGACT